MKKLSILIPYRNRAEHLKQFIPHYRKLLPYADITLIEQADDQPFNRGKLLNIGWLETREHCDYTSQHDIDMLGIRNRVDYSYPKQPTHLATHVSQFHNVMPYPEYFGGVTLFNHADMELVRGYSNHIWGWGCEDNLLYDTILKAGLKPAHRQCWFKSLHHKKNGPNHPYYAESFKIMQEGLLDDDGVFHCQYEVLDRIQYRDYLHIKVKL